MGFMDMIKKSVLEQFQSVTVGQMALSVGVAFLMGIFILLVYRQTFRGVLYSKGFAISLVLLAMVTALVIRTISSNLALSLGMVGAFACFGVGLLYFVISLFHKKLQSPYLLVLRYEPDKTANIAKALKTLPRHRVKSRTMTRDGAELTLEISLKDNEMATIDQFLQVDGVLDASLVSYEGEFGL